MKENIQKNLFYILLGFAALFSAYGFYSWQIVPNLVGVVESRFHAVGARESGRIQELFVAVGDMVEQGRVLIQLDVSDLEAEKASLRDELDSLERILEADRHRYAMENDRLRLQLSQQLGDVQSKLGELNSLNKEIERLESAEDAGLGHWRELSEMTIRRDALSRFISEQSAIIKKNLQSKGGKQTAAINVMTSMLGNRIETINEILHALVLVNQRIQYRTIRAPCDGPVVEITAREGDTVTAYVPIITVEDANVFFVEAYVPESQSMQGEVGQAAHIVSKRSDRYNAYGRVSFIHPGYQPIPQRLTFRGQVGWARRIRVELEPGHSLLPGEAVRVELMRKSKSVDDLFASASAQADQDEKSKVGANVLTPIDVPEALAKASRFEPSGLIWLPDIQRYLVVSDDTGYPDVNDHGPWLFFMKKDGAMEPAPVTLAGIDSVNDLEAISAGPGDRIYLFSSQNISKKGKRPASRQYLIEVEREGRKLTALRKVELLATILSSYNKKQIQALGLTETASDGLPTLNIEAAAYHQGSIFFGLKQPISGDGALIWKLDDPERFFQGEPLAADQLSVFGKVHLAPPGSPSGGFSDLTFDEQGRLLVLSTLPGVPNDKQIGRAFRITRRFDGELDVEALGRFPGVKPEGICLGAEGRILIVFDADQETPSFMQLEGP